MVNAPVMATAGRTEAAFEIEMDVKRLHGAGRLSPALSLLIDTRAALHAATAAALAPYDALGGALLESEPPVPLRADAFDRTIAAIEAGIEAEPDIAAFPEPLRDIASKAARTVGWRRMSPSIKSLDLDMGDGASARILRLPPGAKTPMHTHEGREYTLVLTGAFSDGRRRYGPGDVCIADGGVTHRPVAEAGEICYALAVEEGPLKFTGALGLLQRAINVLN